jgi:hypothetical protein
MATSTDEFLEAKEEAFREYAAALAQGDTDEAGFLLAFVMDDEEPFPEILRALERRFRDSGDSALARKARRLRAHVLRDPNERRLHQLWARAEQASGRFDDAAASRYFRLAEREFHVRDRHPALVARRESRGRPVRRRGSRRTTGSGATSSGEDDGDDDPPPAGLAPGRAGRQHRGVAP